MLKMSFFVYVRTCKLKFSETAFMQSYINDIESEEDKLRTALIMINATRRCLYDKINQRL